MKLGASAQNIFPKTHTLEGTAGSTFYAMGFLTALILWGFGLVWLFFASASIVQCRRFPFNIGWWGFTFPLGVYAASTCQLGRELPSTFFSVLGTVSIYLPSTDSSKISNHYPDSFPMCSGSLDCRLPWHSEACCHWGHISCSLSCGNKIQARRGERCQQICLSNFSLKYIPRIFAIWLKVCSVVRVMFYGLAHIHLIYIFRTT